MNGNIAKVRIGYVAVDLSSEEAEAFKHFLKYKDKIGFLIKNEALDIKRGSVTINFSKDGDILSLDKHLYTYSPKSDNY